MNTKKIAVLGTGAMGSRLVQNLLAAGYPVTIYNRTADKVQPLLDRGAIYAVTPREAADRADIIISMVRDNDASRQVWLDPESGAILGLGKEAIAIESSTLTVEWSIELAAAIERHGSAFLDAPVVGSRPQAEAGKLIYLVGGNAEVLTTAEPVLLAAGGAIVHHLGSIGSGMAMKLAVNALFGVQVAALAEILGLLDKQGISSDRAMASLGELPVISPAAKVAGSLMVTNNHAPLFPIDLVEKDFRYVLQTAQAADASMPLSTAIHNIFQAAIDLGFGNNNITGVVRLYIPTI
ncbi:NAD(P)-dependent oxidoreductase [Chamaesiphon minutus]|uniref:Beta-hydroxyacid dehydrogenase, 3-hydroxyisobutyrate dehydrogenase n=1 Tax=Chamaesiphon minutus (strain ATCC 27169 / PCC 6605) TaxID=1173020 RepID=K9URY4_CHAP6|nr:NAD(P)-dependent oxidoreductase [Chamaesiphon minutus]AFY97034.1 beta-hydroxyacid dehydrogenase, 3-hydroxyisobutyrate dehydrogenase [Chamaesiphon minutus PCC 6605]